MRLLRNISKRHSLKVSCDESPITTHRIPVQRPQPEVPEIRLAGEDYKLNKFQESWPDDREITNALGEEFGKVEHRT